MNMKYNLPQRVQHDICRIAEENGIEKVILFGSRAKGTNTERSDIDIAVCGNNFDGFYWDINEKVHSLLSFDIVNLNDLNDLNAINDETSCELKDEIERDGITIYEKAR